MNKLTAESARQELIKLKVWENDGVLTLKEERYLQALEIALPILEQQERGEGEWIEWGGGPCKVSNHTFVEVRYAAGYKTKGKADIFDWRIRGFPKSIIAYRIIPEQPTNQNGEQ